MNQRDEIVQKILIEGVDDWVPIDRLIGYAKKVSGDSLDFRDVAIDVLRMLLGEQLAEVGHVGGAEGSDSEGFSAEALTRVIADCDSLRWQPKGGGYWLSNTPKGDRYVETTNRPGSCR